MSSATVTPVSSLTLTEAIDHPAHYQGEKLEVIDIIEDFELNFSLGNALKYILRAGYKNPELKKEDLQKAIWYIERELKNTAGVEGQ